MRNRWMHQPGPAPTEPQAEPDEGRSIYSINTWFALCANCGRQLVASRRPEDWRHAHSMQRACSRR